MFDNKNNLSRRDFLIKSSSTSLSLIALGSIINCAKPVQKIKMGLVTYQWGKDWDLPTLIKNCGTAGYFGVELRTQHAHGVEPSLNAQQRKDVKQRFADSPVECIGYGSNQEFHSPDPEVLRKNIEGTFALIKLSHDIGASGVKVKPNRLLDDVPHEKTIEQIGRSLNEVGKFAADYGQKIRVEVHGHGTQKLPVMKAIFDHVTEPNVRICWNSNDEDLLPPGLEANFNMVKDRFGDTVHVRELNIGEYPYQKLFDLFAGMNYKGWILLEARTKPADRVAAMKEQLAVFNEMTAKARG